MRPRFIISIFVLAAMLLAIVFWLWPVKHATTPISTQETQHTNSQADNANLSSQYIPSTPLSAVPSTNQKSSAAINPRSPEGVRQYIESQNKPIEFYGLIIDQDSNSISGVRVKIGIRHWTMPDPAILQARGKDIDLERTSDASGRFEFHGATGDDFGVVITKDGYLSPPNARYVFGPQAGTYENPIIFKMWKMGEPQKLVSHRTLFGFQRDGRIYTLDLLNNKKIEGENADGDLRIKFQCPSIKPNQPYPWTLEISAVGGGLIETTDEFTYLAPESGYQPEVLLQATSVAPSAVPDFTKTYYIKTRNGQNYGVVQMQIYSDYRGQSAMLVNSRINPNGSRNLQP